MTFQSLYRSTAARVRAAYLYLFRWLGEHPFVLGSAGTFVGFAIVALAFIGFSQQRQQALQNAQRTSTMLTALISSHLETNLGLYDLILSDAVASIRDPRTATLPPDLRRTVLFG
ncbi:MAG: hypothetical protein V4793_42665, partial [Paraburkholderia tropica]